MSAANLVDVTRLTRRAAFAPRTGKYAVSHIESTLRDERDAYADEQCGEHATVVAALGGSCC
jgi:hypothetical protein